MTDTFREISIDDWWVKIEGDPDLSLQRRGLLRHYLRNLHRESSRALATGNRDHLKEIRQEEEALQNWWRRKLNHVDWDQLFDLATAEATPEWPPLHLPQLETLPLHLELNRSDRKWELTLFEEAMTQGWSLFQVVVESALGEVEALHHRLEQAAPWDSWVLYVEAASDKPLQSLWKGRWWWISRKTEKELSEELTPLFHPLLIERVFTSPRNPAILS